MPTGYTCIIEDNEVEPTFEEFALRCARAFGATIHQRDEGLDSPARPSEVSPHYAEEIAKYEAEIGRARSLTETELRAAIEEANRKRDAENERYRSEHERKQARYRSMIAKLAHWCPPTPQHEELKGFMTEQIALCYRTDEEPFQVPEGPQTPEGFREELIRSAQQRIAFNKEYAAKDDERAKNSAKWLGELRASLKEYGK